MTNNTANDHKQPFLSSLGRAAGVLRRTLFSERRDDDDKTLLDLSCRRVRNALIEALPEATLYIGPEGRIECANSEARRCFLIPGEEPIISSAIRRQELLDAIATAREGRRRDFTFIERDETDKYYSGTASPCAGIADDAPGVIVLVQDLTEIRRAERWRADFLANASHELRTPLASLTGIIETMQGPAKGDEQARAHFLEIMSGQTERMNRLVDDLLLLSRIELREHTAPDDRIDLARLAANVVASMSPLAEEKRMTIRMSGPNHDLYVAGDGDELSQAVENLVGNAIKYAGADKQIDIDIGEAPSLNEAMALAGRQWSDAAHVSIASAEKPLSGRHVVLRVADNGPGVGRRHLPRLAERFYRVDPGRGLVRGTGLGLAIVKHIAMRHRGEFMVESAKGSGTAFGIVLPACDK